MVFLYPISHSVSKPFGHKHWLISHDIQIGANMCSSSEPMFVGQNKWKKLG